jgi:iron complex outermembrane receptor protein
MKKNYFFFILIFASNIASSQVKDSTMVLKEITVQGSKLTAPTFSVRTQKLDSSTASIVTATTVADLLNREAALFVKTYGAGGLATLATQGTGAAHTALIWNGIRINNPMLGLSDLSLVPSFLLDEATLQYGGSGPVQGNGAVGGSLHLNSNPDERKGVHVKLLTGVSSFGGYQQGVSLNMHNGNVLTKTRFYTQGAQNNFKYENFDGRERVQSNAALLQYGFTHDLQIRRADNRFSFHGWYLKNDYKIPPHMFKVSSTENQQDENFRGAIKWERSFKNFDFNILSGINHDFIHYSDPSTLLDEKSNATSMQFDGEVTYKKVRNFNFAFRLTGDHSKARVEAYRGTKELNQLNGAFKSVFSKERINISLEIRNGVHNGNALPLLPSAGLLWNIHHSLQLKANASKVYRVPTLNDRFWVPGGNIDLKPEVGYSNSIGINFQKKIHSFKFLVEVNAFDLLLDNVIVWLPQQGGVYAANNIQQIKSQGLNGIATLNFQKQDFNIAVQFAPQWNNSTITKTKELESLNKQLIYSPRIIYKGNFQVAYKTLSLKYYLNYAGYRFTSTDNNAWLDPYSTSDVVVSYTKEFKNIAVSFVGSIRNILSSNYEVIAYRAMPGINYQGGIVIDFSSAN